MRPSMKSFFVGVFVAVWMIFLVRPSFSEVPVSAEEEVEPEQVSPYAELLEDLSWDIAHSTVVSSYEKRIWKHFTDKKKEIEDTIEIERLRKRTVKDVAEMRGKYIEFKVGVQAYKVSIIEAEFKTGTGESMFRIDDSEAQRYYFFIHDKLWKIFIAYNVSYVRGKAFLTYSKEMVAKFGKFTGHKTEIRRVGKQLEEVLSEVVWEDEEYRVRLVDRTPFFGTYTLVIGNPKVEDRISELRGEIAGLEQSEEQIDPTVKSLLVGIEESSDVDQDEDILDQIIGERTEVDVVQEMPVSEDDFKPIEEETGGLAGPRPASAPSPASPRPKPRPKEEAPGVEGGRDIIY